MLEPYDESTRSYVPDCARETLVLHVGDVTARLWVSELLGQSQVHHVDGVHLLGTEFADQAVLRLDVSGVKNIIIKA